MNSITTILLNIWDRICSAWVACRNFFTRHHLSFFCLFAFCSIRLGVGLAALLYRTLSTAFTSAQSSLSSAINSAPVVSAVHALDVANSFFPLYEAFILGSALLVVKLAFAALNGIRYAYKNIPFKAS